MNELQLRNADLEDPDLQKGQKLATQGQLLLDDVSEDGGGFCCIPGFHRYVDQWVAMFPPDDPLPKQPDLDDPRVQALRPQGFQLKNIPGKAGDLLIWHRWVTPISLTMVCAPPTVIADVCACSDLRCCAVRCCADWLSDRYRMGLGKTGRRGRVSCS